MSASEWILDAPPPAPAVRAAYGAAPEQVADLYLPAGTGPHPAVVLVHGGYWRARYDRAYAGHAASALAGAGFATLNLEYRRVGDPGGGWPGSLDDVRAALRLLATLAPAHRLDASRVTLVGHSAGGQLALAAAAHEAHAPHAPHATSVAGVVSLAGVLDLRAGHALALSDGAVALFLGGSPDEAPGAYAAASPIELPLPRVRQRLLHGDRDPDVPLALSVRYRDAKVARGEDVALAILPGVGHFEPMDPTSAAWPEVLAAIRDARGA